MAGGDGDADVNPLIKPVTGLVISEPKVPIGPGTSEPRMPPGLTVGRTGAGLGGLGIRGGAGGPGTRVGGGRGGPVIVVVGLGGPGTKVDGHVCFDPLLVMEAMMPLRSVLGLRRPCNWAHVKLI